MQHAAWLPCAEIFSCTRETLSRFRPYAPTLAVAGIFLADLANFGPRSPRGPLFLMDAVSEYDFSTTRCEYFLTELFWAVGIGAGYLLGVIA